MFQNKFKNIVFFLSVILSTQPSQAVFMITPSVGYKMQTVKLTDNSDLDMNIKLSDPAYGLKLGIQSISGVGFDIAGDYSAGTSIMSAQGTEQELKYTHTTAAAQLSVSAHVFKIYLGYVFMNEISFKSDTPGDSSKVKGAGYQAGMALALSRSVSLGAEYQIDLFNQVNFESVGSFEDIRTYYKKVDSQSTTFILSYSF